MIFLTIDEIVALHEKLIDKTGGSHGIRDVGLLESSFYSAEASFDDFELFHTVEEKAARLMFSLTKNHAFVDGNKRIGVFVMLVTLELNNIFLVYTQKELINLSLSVADGSKNYDDILNFIYGHK